MNEILLDYENEDAAVVSSCIATYNTAVKDSQILPTFTAQVKLDNKNVVPLRAFKDGGSQASFICRSVADYHRFPIVRDHVQITVRGFNTNKRIKTRIVKIPLKFGDKTFVHDFICVDNIRTQFNVDGMGKLVSGFSAKGYDIADRDYNCGTSGALDNIDMVLGTDTDHMLGMQYHTFGDPHDIDNNSSYIDSSIGVIFSGNIEKMLANLCFLPSNSIEVCCNSITTNYPFILNEIESSPFLEPHPDESLSHNKEINVNSCPNDLAVEENEILFSPQIPKHISEVNDKKLVETCNETLGISEEFGSESETDTNMQLVDYLLTSFKYDSKNSLKKPLSDEICCDQIITIPQPTNNVGEGEVAHELLLNLEKFSKFSKAVGTLAHVMLFIEKLKQKIKAEPNCNIDLFRECYDRATNFLIVSEQKILFQDVNAYLDSPSKFNKDIPALVYKYNLYRDGKGVLRIKSKLPKSPAVGLIFLPKNSSLTSLVIRQTHESLGHRGVFSVMRELRKTFWVESGMTTVKKCLKKCVLCNTTIKPNQNAYRAFRHAPTPECFSSVFINHIDLNAAKNLFSVEDKSTKAAAKRAKVKIKTMSLESLE